ncbi:MAG: hypothetical protein RLZZ436_3636, partial [Planctomycetota bacterium]
MRFPTLLCCLFAASLCSAQQPFTQKVELQPAQPRGADAAPAPAAAAPAISDAELLAGPQPIWIWGPDNDSKYVLRKTFKLPAAAVAARLKVSCDNVCTVYLNGRRVAGGTEWQEPSEASVAGVLVSGDQENVLEAEVANQGGIAGFVLALAWKSADGKPQQLVSDLTWTHASERGAASGQPVQRRGGYGEGPWNTVFANAAGTSRVPAGVFELLPGFQVEKLFTVPKDELGSWVCITF